jgi:tetratricopeptide (TPR) repeat protein
MGRFRTLLPNDGRFTKSLHSVPASIVSLAQSKGINLVHFSDFIKDPNLWYGIGILYDRYGSFEHAEEAFTAVLKMDSKFEKSNEIYFRLGIIYKQQMKYESALDVGVVAIHSNSVSALDTYYKNLRALLHKGIYGSR